MSSTASTTDATAALTALGSIITSLRKAPLPEVDDLPASIRDLRPKPRHISALLKLADCDAMSVSDLADKLQVSLASASQVVSDLVDLGLASRIEDSHDRRRTLVGVSGAHRELAGAVLERRVRPLHDALMRLDPDERVGLTHGLQRLAAELHTINEGHS